MAGGYQQPVAGGCAKGMPGVSGSVVRLEMEEPSSMEELEPRQGYLSGEVGYTAHFR